jgi:membrane protein
MRLTADFHSSLTVVDLVKQTITEVNDDNCLGLAAQLAFYFFLALFPALLFLVALLGYVPIDRSLAAMLAALAPIAPDELLVLLREQIAELTAGRHGTLLTFGVAGALWSSSAAMVAIIDALNRAYDVTEVRPWWKRRMLAILLTIAMATFITGALTTVMAGPDVVRWMTRAFGVRAELSWMWAIARWPLIVLLVVFGIDLVYHFAPNLKRDWAWLTPGSVVATTLWIASSFAFKLYVANFADFNATHGAIGGVIVILLWFYVSSLAILVGAELNGVIEQSYRRQDTTPLRTAQSTS